MSNVYRGLIHYTLVRRVMWQKGVMNQTPTDVKEEVHARRHFGDSHFGGPVTRQGC